MRLIILALLLSAAVPAAAQSKQPKQPKDLRPIPEVPEPPEIPTPGADQEDPSLEPQVTITKRGEDKVEEYRVNGHIYMIKVTPRIGLPYYLIDNQADGKFGAGGTGGLDQGIRPPMWVIRQF